MRALFRWTSVAVAVGVTISSLMVALTVVEDGAFSNTPPDTLASANYEHIICSREELRHGNWKPINLSSAPYNGENATVGESFFTWQWEPESNCSVRRFRPDHFCLLMANNYSRDANGTGPVSTTILFVGDSVSGEHFNVLTGQLGGRLQSLKRKQFAQSQINCTKLNTKQERPHDLRLIFRRCDFLNCVGQALNRFQPQILIVNRGSHVVRDQQLQLDLDATIVPAVRSWQDSCQNKCKLVLRTTAPGHPHCSQFRQPQTSPLAMQELLDTARDPTSPYHSYRWYDIARQNEILVRSFANKIVTFSVIDAYEPMLLRPDRHANPDKDCLHSQLPGRLEHWNDALFHWLSLDETRLK